LGIIELSGFRRFVMADIPGLIEGAHDGAGLGHDFLKHIERTRILVHLLDILPPDNSDPVENFYKISRELQMHSTVLVEKPQVVVLNKADLDPEGIFCEDIRKRLPDTIKQVFIISAVSGQGITELNECLWSIAKGKNDEPDSD
jgi:GTP-binding protein